MIQAPRRRDNILDYTDPRFTGKYSGICSIGVPTHTSHENEGTLV